MAPRMWAGYLCSEVSQLSFRPRLVGLVPWVLIVTMEGVKNYEKPPLMRGGLVEWVARTGYPEPWKEGGGLSVR